MVVWNPGPYKGPQRRNPPMVDGGSRSEKDINLLTSGLLRTALNPDLLRRLLREIDSRDPEVLDILIDAIYDTPRPDFMEE